MENDIFNQLLVWGIGCIFSIVIFYFVFRWTLSIRRQLWNQKMQIELLIIIAQKLGADTDNEDFKRLKNANRGISDLY